MKYTIATIALLMVFSATAFSQVKAVTENGEEVLLLNDGTWKYTSIQSGYDTRLDTLVREKGERSTFLIKGEKVNYGIWLDPKKWSFKKGKDDDVQEYIITMKGQDAYAMVIPERIPIPLNLLEEAAINNFKKKDPNARIERIEVRKINGNTVKLICAKVSPNGAKFSYMGYYFSDEKRTIQFIGFTSQNLMDTYKNDIEELLDGFVLLD